MKMPWKSNKDDTKERTPTVRDLSEEDRADIDALLEDGTLPSEISREMNVPLVVVQSIRRMQIRKRDEAKKADSRPAAAPAAADPNAEMRMLLVRQIEMAELEARLQKIKDDNAYEKEKRDLELKIKRMELKAKELELEDPGEDQGEELDPGAMISEDGDLQLWGFLRELLKKGPRAGAEGSPSYVGRSEVDLPSPSPAPPPSPQPDVTQPLSDEQIEREIAKATPADIAQIQAAPASIVRNGLKQRYPGISKENLEKIMQKLKPTQRKLK